MGKDNFEEFTFKTRKVRGYEKEKSHLGLNQFWTPTICGVPNPDGTECLEERPPGLSMCWRHQQEYRERDRVRIAAQRHREVSS